MSGPETIYPASKLGEYKIFRNIAEGTFGKVKMATHTVTGQKVAMKYISKAAIYHNKTKTRVQREVEYMRALRHPHIIKLYEVISTPNYIIIVLEYAGGELFNYIVEHGRLPEPQARQFFQQLISGIQYSHSIKIVHRDLKPENVLLDDDLNVKIADFGLSNEIRDGDFLKTSCGSPNYAAPEVIRGARYTGPEIDVWSSGVILYVMLCGRLPFEDEDVQRLFAKINQGQYVAPNYLSEEAKSLIRGMLVVDAVKRITIPEITRHSFYTTNLPRYLTPLPPPPGPVLGTLTSLVVSSSILDLKIVEGMGRIDDKVVEDLANRMEGVQDEDIWEALRRDDGVQGNAVKVAYMLLRDKMRSGRDLAQVEEEERDAMLAVMDPCNVLSPMINSMNFDEEHEIGQGEDGGDVSFDMGSFPEASNDSMNSFAILDTSLPFSVFPEPQLESASYTNTTVRRNAATVSPTHERFKPPYHGQRRMRWHFGIRSQSPPMEVMLEIYRTLHVLGMEWKEKRDLGGLGGVPRTMQGTVEGRPKRIQRNPEMDGSWREDVDFKAASDIYFVEARARVHEIIILMNLQLYMVDSINYLVDFTHKASYCASTEPSSGKFDATVPRERPRCVNESEVVSPYAFMDVACRLILELAGTAE